MTSDYEYVLSFDPGKSSAAVLGRYAETVPYELVEGFQFGGGTEGLKQWVNRHLTLVQGNYAFSGPPWVDPEVLDWCCEVFVPLNGKGFGHTRDSVEPVAGEGLLHGLGVIDRYDMTRMRRPNEMYFVGGSTKAEKRKRLKAFLRETGNYRTGKQLGAPDNEDFVSATAHGIAYTMKTLRHQPTFDLVSNWVAEHDRITP